MVAEDLSNGSLAHLRASETAVKGGSEAGGGERRLEWMDDRMGAGFADSQHTPPQYAVVSDTAFHSKQSCMFR